MKSENWFKSLPAPITVTDAAGIIVEINEAAAEMFKKDGGRALIGKDVMDCHPEPSCSRLRGMYANQSANVYTITKNGKKKLIYQTPYFSDDVFSGFVEICLDLPDEMPHFNRDA
ncbi:MAG: PAS domain-containing protein [Chloroflexi bacterium]|nr:PAS domain-containing protein [Chloroflexota bacterium]